MFNLSRADDLVQLVRSIKSVRELNELKKILQIEEHTTLLRDTHVYEALKEIPIQIAKLIKDNPHKVIAEIVSFLH